MSDSDRNRPDPNGDIASPNGDGQAPERSHDAFAQRLRKHALAKGLNSADLARLRGIPRGTMGRYWTGERLPNAELVFELADDIEVDPRWLVAGESTTAAVGDRRLTWRGADPEQDADLVELDEIDFRYGLGGSYLEGTIAVRKRQFSREWLRNVTRANPDLLFWAETDGDSMEPTIRSREVVLIDRGQDSVRTGDGIWAVAFGDIGMIKRLRPLPGGTIELHSDNKEVPLASAADGELHVIGRVVAVVRRL